MARRSAASASLARVSALRCSGPGAAGRGWPTASCSARAPLMHCRRPSWATVARMPTSAAVHGCAGFGNGRRGRRVAGSYREVWILPHHLDPADVGEKYADNGSPMALGGRARGFQVRARRALRRERRAGQRGGPEARHRAAHLHDPRDRRRSVEASHRLVVDQSNPQGATERHHRPRRSRQGVGRRGHRCQPIQPDAATRRRRAS